MARTKGASAHLRVLDLFNNGKPTVTPQEIEEFIGAGPYSSKYICYLKNDGHEITTNKQGRTVVSYTYVGPGDSATRAAAKPVAAAKPAKVAKPKAVKTPKVKVSKQTPVKAAARNVLKEKADREAEELLAQIGAKNAGEYAGGTYSVDPDWDSMDGIDVANFLK